MENPILALYVAKGRGDWRGGDHSDPGGNINPLLWGGYKVYRVKICG